MRDNLENTKSTQEKSVYKKIGLGIYIIFALIYYFFMKDMFLDGTFFLVVGIALLLIIISVHDKNSQSLKGRGLGDK